MPRRWDRGIAGVLIFSLLAPSAQISFAAFHPAPRVLVESRPFGMQALASWPISHRLILKRSQTAPLMGKAILQEFDRSYGNYREITRRAGDRFMKADWQGVDRDAMELIQTYRLGVDALERLLKQMYSLEELQNPSVWANVETFFVRTIHRRYEADLAIMFFRSFQRRIFLHTGIPVEYTDGPLFEKRNPRDARPTTRYAISKGRITAFLIRRLLVETEIRSSFEDMYGDSVEVARRIEQELTVRFHAFDPESLEVLKPVFYRNKEAYVIARIRSGSVIVPFVLALRQNQHTKTEVDAVLIGEGDLRDIFLTSTRAALRVDSPYHREILDFLETLAPQRGRPALAAAIGLTNMAKVLLNRELSQQLENREETFVQPKGVLGTRMVVFTGSVPQSLPYVFKVIRNVRWQVLPDGSELPTHLEKDEVMVSYRWLNETDRLGRMLDAWIYRNFSLPIRLLSKDILNDLLNTAHRSVSRVGENLILNHLYVMRKVIPLDVYLRQIHLPEERQRILTDFGRCLKELALGGIFIGDCQVKNFGVTHGGRVVLYDPDSVTDLDVLNFRPSFDDTPGDDSDEQAAYRNTMEQGTASLGKDDLIFDWWVRWNDWDPADLDFFKSVHGDLFDMTYWKDLQKRRQAGNLPDVYPYPAERRLHRLLAAA